MIERQFREENIIFIKIQNDSYPRNFTIYDSIFNYESF